MKKKKAKKTEKPVSNLWRGYFLWKDGMSVKEIAMKLNEKEDIVKAWQDHANELDKKARFLNEKKYKTMHYRAPGTDLKIDLHEKHKWLSAGSTDKRGVTFIAKWPSEEVFTTPLKTGANGYVTSTKPLNYGGTLIENLTLTYENGKIIDAKAEKGLETFNNYLLL